MFKTRLLDNKDTLVALVLFIGFILLLIGNAVILLPQLISVYTPRPRTERVLPIDADMVNQAVEFLK